MNLSYSENTLSQINQAHTFITKHKKIGLFHFSLFKFKIRKDSNTIAEQTLLLVN